MRIIFRAINLNRKVFARPVHGESGSGTRVVHQRTIKAAESFHLDQRGNRGTPKREFVATDHLRAESFVRPQGCVESIYFHEYRTKLSFVDLR